MGTSIQKQYIELCGKPIICYCLEAFEKSEIIDDVIMVAGAGQEDYVTEEIVNKYPNCLIASTACLGGELSTLTKNLIEAEKHQIVDDITLYHNKIVKFILFLKVGNEGKK